MITLKLFGGVTLVTETGVLSGRAVQRRRLALLALLAGQRKPLSREKVTAYLWPESDAEQARHLLSVAVYELRKSLGEQTIVTTREDVALNAQLINSDVDQFESAIAARDHVRAADLYTGPFMDGFHINDAPEFERWVDGERDRLARAYAATLERLAVDHTSAGNTEAAVAAWRKLAAHDPYNGRIASMLMLALEANGDRAAALQHARTHAALLREEFGADPDPEVEAVADRLRTEPREAGARVPVSEVRTTTTPQPDDAIPLRRRWVIVAAALTAVATVFAMVGIVIWRTRSVPPAQAEANAVQSIAVLPFQSMGEPTNMADGLSEEIINALSSLPSLNVVARSSAFRFRGDIDVVEVGQQLKVEHILEGTVRRAGGQLKITARLINAKTGFKVWNEDYDRPYQMANLLEIQEDIAQAVVGALQAQLTPQQPAGSIVTRRTNDVVAFELFVTGRGYLHRRTVPDMQRALVYFQRAIERDSTYALAYAGMAEVLTLLGAYDYGAMRPSDAFPAARAAAERALELDPSAAEAHTALASILFNYDRNWTAAEREYRRAIELNHGYSTARHWYSLLLNARGRRSEASENIMRARELDPQSSVTATGLARHYYFSRDFARAIAEYKRALAVDSSFVTAHVGLGLTYAISGQHDAALGQFDAAARLLGMTPPLLHGLRAYTLGRAGRKAEAAPHIRQIEAVSKRTYVPAEYLAIAHLGAGNLDGAFAEFEKAMANRSGGVVLLPVDPIADPMRRDPRFKRLIAQLEAKNR